MTTPTVVSSMYQADSSAFRSAKVDRSGSPREEYFTVTVPNALAIGSFIGLVPFQTGAKFGYDSSVFVSTALGASVTGTLGYVYDDNVTFTNDPDAFGASQTLNTTGKLLTNNSDGLAWKAVDSVVGTGALANGWIVIQTAGAVTTGGVIQGHIVLAYDQP